MSEGHLQSSIIKYCKDKDDIYCARINAGSVITKQGRYYSGAPAGFSDLLICVPGKVLMVELKTGKGRLSKSQMKFQKQMYRLNIPYHVIRSLKQFKEMIDEFI